jgi:ApaG protein
VTDSDREMGSSEECTEGVRVAVRSRYSPKHSDPARSNWFFLYTIRIVNEGEQAVQLVSRHWIITDATGKVEEVRGPGVVGEQPHLEVGESFEYTSGCPLETPFGNMRGSFQMLRENDSDFDAEIGRFELREPGALH